MMIEIHFDYLRENADQVIQQLGCTDYIGYKVIPYMCMNKVLVSRYKKVTFPIVSYPECFRWRFKISQL